MASAQQTALWAVALALLCLAPPAALAQDTRADGDLKAAIVYNFARFALWPPSRFADASAPVVLCVAPTEPLQPALARLERQPVAARRLHIRTTTQFGAGCHLAYVSASAIAPTQIAALNQQGVLTVGDAPSFSRIGAIGLVKVGRQIRFEINTAAARAAGVKLSSQLMRLAMVVR